MNGASCPTCGWVLRWLPEQGAYGCDRCRKLVPAAQVAPQPAQPQPSPQQQPAPSPYAPQAGPAPAAYSPHAAPPMPGYPMPPPARRSGKGLAIGLGLGGVAAAGAAIAIVLATRGGGGSGAGSRDDLVKGALAAMSEGNVEKLVKLGNPIELQSAMLDCSERDKQKADRDKDKGGDTDGEDGGKDAVADDDVDDPQIQEKRLRRQHEKLVEKTKGMKIELVSIAGEREKDKDPDAEDPDDKAKQRKKGTRKGDEITKGCVLKVDVALHELTAKVKVTEPDGKEPSEGEARLSVIEAGGSWFLVMAPRLSAGGGAIASGLRKYRDKMCACKDVKCAEDVSDDMRDWSKTVRDEAKALSRDERKPLDEIDDEMKACRRKLREGDLDAEAREVMAKFEEIKSKMCACADRACADRIQKELERWSDTMTPKVKAKTPTAEEQKRATELMTAYAECSIKARAEAKTEADDPPPPPPDDPDTSGGSGLSSVPACAEYRRGIEKLRSCARYPRSAADALKRAYEQMEQGWAASSGNAAYREAITKSCASGADSMKKLLESMCP
jgi:hypothetical protein